jgi:DNA-directed RNA polymerase specialized sigma24 family protein
VLQTEKRSTPLSPFAEAGLVADAPLPDEELLRAERREALLAGLAELPPRMRELLLLLLHDDPPLSYAQITERTGMPIGSIGPTRARALERLRLTAPMQRFLNSRERTTGQTGHGREVPPKRLERESR